MGHAERHGMAGRAQPGHSGDHRPGPTVDCRRRGRDGRDGGTGVRRLAPNPRDRTHFLFVQVPTTHQGLLRGRRAHDHPRGGKDHRRGPGRAAARCRERRGGCRPPFIGHGIQHRGCRQRHRRDHDSATARRGRRHRAVQLPGHDSPVVPAVRNRMWQLFRPEAVRTGSADDAEDIWAA